MHQKHSIKYKNLSIWFDKFVYIYMQIKTTQIKNPTLKTARCQQLALFSLHKEGHGPSLRTAYGAPTWTKFKHICPEDAERMGSPEYLFTLLPMNSTQLQVMLASVFSTSPRSFLLDNT